MSQLPVVAKVEMGNFSQETCPSPAVGDAIPGALVLCTLCEHT